VQPVATCRQSPYLQKPAIVIVTSFSLWHLAPTALTAPGHIMTSFSWRRLAPTALAAPVLILTSFSLWRHSLGHAHRYRRTDTLPRLIYKDLIYMQLIYYNWQYSWFTEIANIGTAIKRWCLIRNYLHRVSKNVPPSTCYKITLTHVNGFWYFLTEMLLIM